MDTLHNFTVYVYDSRGETPKSPTLRTAQNCALTFVPRLVPADDMLKRYPEDQRYLINKDPSLFISSVSVLLEQKFSPSCHSTDLLRPASV